jgi:hypothetical protein
MRTAFTVNAHLSSYTDSSSRNDLHIKATFFGASSAQTLSALAAESCIVARLGD